jgi:hypothetical protein
MGVRSAAPDRGWQVTFVMPKVGDTVWYYFDHAFWDVPLENFGNIKRWRFTGRTELRARVARVLHVTGNGSSVILSPEYASEDRVKFDGDGVSAALAKAKVSAYVHVYRFGCAYFYGRIVDGILPEANHWGYDPLPPLQSGRG